MTTAVASAAGTSTVLGIGRTGYLFSWVEIRYPHEAGYQVYWAQIRLPYLVGQVVLLQGAHAKKSHPRLTRPIVDDTNDLHDLCNVWELIMRKAA